MPRTLKKKTNARGAVVRSIISADGFAVRSADKHLRMQPYGIGGVILIPFEDSTLKDNEALYFIIAITEESDLVMDWYGVHLEWEGDGDKVSRDQVKVDADLFKTEIIGDDGVILDYDAGKIIGDDGEVVIGGNSQTFGKGE